MITVLEQKSCKYIFEYAYAMLMMNKKAIDFVYWLNDNQKWHLLEYHLQEEFPNGADIDDYANYVVNNVDKIFEKIS